MKSWKWLAGLIVFASCFMQLWAGAPVTVQAYGQAPTMKRGLVWSFRSPRNVALKNRISGSGFDHVSIHHTGGNMGQPVNCYWSVSMYMDEVPGLYGLEWTQDNGSFFLGSISDVEWDAPEIWTPVPPPANITTWPVYNCFHVQGEIHHIEVKIRDQEHPEEWWWIQTSATHP